MNSGNEWQTWAALVVVTLTFAIFVFRAFSRRKTGCCGKGCGCAASKMPKELMKGP